MSMILDCIEQAATEGKLYIDYEVPDFIGVAQRLESAGQALGFTVQQVDRYARGGVYRNKLQFSWCGVEGAFGREDRVEDEMPKVCKICRESPTTVILSPCRHFVCSTCKAKWGTKCPHCLEEVTVAYMAEQEPSSSSSRKEPSSSSSRKEPSSSSSRKEPSSSSPGQEPSSSSSGQEPASSSTGNEPASSSSGQEPLFKGPASSSSGK